MVIRLNERSDLSITASAAHALAILRGETVFSHSAVTVFDGEGELVGEMQLLETIQRNEKQQR